VSNDTPNLAVLRRLAGLCPLLILCAGCMGGDWWLFKPSPPPPSSDNLVLRGDKLEQVAFTAGPANGDLDGGKEFFRKGDYAQAETLFKKVADNTKNLPHVAEEGRFYEGECLLQTQQYPRAAAIFSKLLSDFPSGQYRDQANQRLFEIANFWLEDTRAEMRASKEAESNGSWTWPSAFIHFDKTKPVFDEEGWAIERLEQVHMNDPIGPLGVKALFIIGNVKFYRGHYKDADFYFDQIVKNHANSPLAKQALEYAIICKQLSGRGPENDGRRLAEARQLIDIAHRAYPDLVREKGEFLENRLAAINHEQADHDFSVAEFYRRVGHPGAAYFYYELIRRRYPGTRHEELAKVRIEEMRQRLEQEKQPSWWQRLLGRRPTENAQINPAVNPPDTQAPLPQAYQRGLPSPEIVGSRQRP
jgi:outer membrane protein assembly factor BamD (BamD/ComL family)